MDNPTNIEIFDLCVGLFFAELYKNFPKRIDIRFADVPHSLFDEIDSMALVEQKFEMYEHAAKWLYDSGYVLAHHVDARGAEGIVLSFKGLEALHTKPRSLFSRKRIGEQIVDAVKDGAKLSVQKAVSIALTNGAKIVLGQI